MTVISDAWTALRAERRQEEGWHLRRIHVDASCELFAGVHQSDNTPGLIMEIDADKVPPGLRMPKSAGFRLDTALLGHSHSGRVRIALSLAHPAYATVFAVLCDDTAACAAEQSDERSALSSFIGRLHVWQAFMAKHGPDGLSETAVVGLMGELLMLAEHIAPLLGPGGALLSWAGPRGEPNDFEFVAGYLEVKSTTRQAPDRVTISNADQLDVGRGRILLAHVHFRPSAEGATLPELIEAFRSRLATDAPASLAAFNALLLSVGYVDAQQEAYTLRLAADSVQLFEVAPDFPHIARCELRAGIIDCIYDLDLVVCALWAVPLMTLQSLIQAP